MNRENDTGHDDQSMVIGFYDFIDVLRRFNYVFGRRSNVLVFFTT